MVFGCISKNFLENIFWCLEKKKENTNLEKHKPQTMKKSSTTTLNTVRLTVKTQDRDRRRDRNLREIAPSIAISIRLREIAINGAISPSTATRMFAGEIAIARVRSLSLSLSLSFSGNTLKGKQKCKMISVVKGFFFSVNEFQFPENRIFRTNQTASFPEKHFRK